MKILSGEGDYNKVKAELKIYGYFKDNIKIVLKSLPPGIVKHVESQLKEAKNGLRFLSQDGTWYSFLKLEDKKRVTTESYRRIGAGAAKDAEAVHANRVVVVMPSGNISTDDAACALTEGIVLARYSYDDLKTSSDDKKAGKGPGPVISVYSFDRKKVSGKVMDRARMVADAVNEARGLADAPSNLMTPTVFTKEVSAEAKKQGVRVKVLDRPVLQKMGWGAFLGVAQGSAEPPKVVILEYKGSKKTGWYALVGKGITFDSGGISIKPSSGMEDMKFDMCGAAAVAMTTILAARLRLPLNIVAVMPLTENMPGGRAQKPGDVVKTLSGKTVEIISTDAEGRMILADALNYAVKTYRPKAIIDLATLTGACVVALGTEASGIMGSDDKLVKALIKAGEESGDRLWELPMWDDYKDLLKSEVADIKNAGSRWAGTIQGGIFLKEFIGDANWAHIDIAGTAYLEKPKPYFKRGATGAGIRLLVQFFEGL